MKLLRMVTKCISPNAWKKLISLFSDLVQTACAFSTLAISIYIKSAIRSKTQIVPHEGKMGRQFFFKKMLVIKKERFCTELLAKISLFAKLQWGKKRNCIVESQVIPEDYQESLLKGKMVFLNHKSKWFQNKILQILRPQVYYYFFAMVI